MDSVKISLKQYQDILDRKREEAFKIELRNGYSQANSLYCEGIQKGLLEARELSEQLELTPKDWQHTANKNAI